MRPAVSATVVAAGALGIFVLVTTYLVTWTTTGFFDGLTTLLPVPVAFSAGSLMARKTGLLVCLWMSFTIELSSGYVNPFVLVVTLAPWFVGVVINDRQRLVRKLAEVGAEIELESQLLAEEAVRLERARIAHELHDIVAHCVSVMVVQAYAGERLAVADQQGATEAFDHITSAVERAKLEIADLVNLLADEPTDEMDRKLTQKLEALVAGAVATGLAVRLHIGGDPDAVPSETGLIAYRVVQESVTNALKHAPGSPIDIVVDCGKEIAVDVVNRLTPVDGPGLGPTGGGHGLVGIGDRIRGAGGTFEAGPRDVGSWRVSVRFPRIAPAPRSS